MNIAKKSRTVARTMFTKTANELKKLFTAQPVDETALSITWSLLQDKFEILKNADRDVWELLLQEEENEEILVTEVSKTDEYTRVFLELEQKYQSNLREGRADSLSSHRTVVTEQGMCRKFKLPVIEFKKFSGHIREWLPFWSQFQKIHSDPDIPEEDKFQYLIQTTVQGSRARAVVESFPPTRENYQKALDSLKARFGRDDLLVEFYVRELLKLVLQNSLSREKCGLSDLYDKIETQLRALETLGVTSDKCAAMLYPLVESCLPEELLRTWQRSPSASKNDEEKESTDRLNSVINFLKNEVENEERITLAIEGFGNTSADTKDKKVRPKNRDVTPTATNLVNNTARSCIFCSGRNHASTDCFKAQKLNIDEKKKLISETKACFKCLKPGHQSTKCPARIKCPVCSGQHVTIMCMELKINKCVPKSDKRDQEKSAVEDKSLGNFTNTPVFLQTLRVKLRNGNLSKEIRAVIDTGSQRSYISKSTAEYMQYQSKRTEILSHGLFGGEVSPKQKHRCYEIELISLDATYSCNLEVLDQPIICNNIPPVHNGCWTEELEKMGIVLSDTKSNQPVELLLGADVAGRLLTGEKYELNCGLVTMKTHAGWTLMGRVQANAERGEWTGNYISLLCKDISISAMWKLETIGISDPGEMKNKEEAEQAVREHFQQTIKMDETGRYEVNLPWRNGHPPLPRNEKLAETRLNNILSKLRNNGKLEDYQQVFDNWLSEGIIEEVPKDELTNIAHYLPHRPVFKENSSTTKIRPVYDASAHEKGTPALNHCLETGENLIKLIPKILLKFRLYKYGLSADIGKAFLQIGITSSDREYLRFLWINKNGDLIHMRHKRVVFGLCCSPFLLGATIEYHLKRMEEECEFEEKSWSDVITQLAQGFYVDNCLVSVPTKEEAKEFQQKATTIMSKGKFELRCWERSYNTTSATNDVPILGLFWSTRLDTLSINGNSIDGREIAKVTKREILSLSQKIFDPIGYLCPALLQPKLLLQKSWNLRMNWDTEVPEDIRNLFINWWTETPILKTIQLPRWVDGVPDGKSDWSLHTFVDASKNAYAAAVYLRVIQKGEVKIHLLQAKARVAPLKPLSIPRLELLAATIGARLYSSIINTINCEDITTYFWSDSSTVLAWIQEEEQWATFVWNRVKEIRTLTEKENWRHIPGTLNPADLPSRGCTPRQLVESRWWEGPKWLYEHPNLWPKQMIEIDANEVNAEKKKGVITSLISLDRDYSRFYKHFSNYCKNVRMLAWINRFLHNCRHPANKLTSELSKSEYQEAENRLIRLVQEESFEGDRNDALKNLDTYKDDNGVIRLKTAIANTDDEENFRFPAILPAKHIVVERMIHQHHINNCHVGVQSLLVLLRENFWILGGRKAVRKVVKQCVRCRRYAAKPLQTKITPLPANRVNYNAQLFEVVGVDLAGPVYLKPNKKAWICLYTCAVYRAVHLELVTSLSTNTFLQSFRRFIARRGRPRIVYSDNGTNFVGVRNALKIVDWTIIKQYSVVRKIEWRLNPPSAAWWGGWWERLIGLLKNLLRRVLGRACLQYEEFITRLCECEVVMNNRPLTYVSNEPKDLNPLTPAMFMRDSYSDEVPDLDAIDNTSLNGRIKYLKKVRNDLRRRFRSEYLGLLKQTFRKSKREVALNELVFVGDDVTKRMNWPLGRVIELFPGQDKVTRVVRVKTDKGVLTRPIQRLVPLEIPVDTEMEETSVPDSASTTDPAVDIPIPIPADDSNVSEVRGEVYVTRSGRKVKKLVFSE